ncbi:MAG: DUF983 domain-containing protein [Bacteroidia bacterium]
MNLLASILRLKCPNCRTAPLFNHPNMYHPKHILDMPKKCSNCGQEYFLEPGFYFGAMFISYALSVGTSVVLFILFYFILHFSKNGTLLSISGILLIVLPYQIRLARAIWLAIFYKENKRW